MKNTVITSILATISLSLFAFFNNVPKRIIKSKAKTYNNKRTKPIIDESHDQFDLFI